MRGLLRGVIRDHRLPGDYLAPTSQPLSSRAFLNVFTRSMMTRMLKNNYVHFPVTYFFFFGLPLFFSYSWFKAKQTGSYPQILQPQYWLYRNNQGLYGYQSGTNANPDNHFDRMKNCWTSDPNCGWDVAPKRPWLDLKDPSKHLLKLSRDADENKHVKAMGWRGH